MFWVHVSIKILNSSLVTIFILLQKSKCIFQSDFNLSGQKMQFFIKHVCFDKKMSVLKNKKASTVNRMAIKQVVKAAEIKKCST